jgi:DNA-binding response OmpR family regulator
MMRTTLRHALIIEDEMVTGMDMQMMLADIGFDSFAFASTALQALDQARLRKPDLVTADVGLLDGNGVDACLALQAHYGPLPIIYVTGQPDLLQLSEGVAIVAKPFGAADIIAAYQAVANQARAA